MRTSSFLGLSSALLVTSLVAVASAQAPAPYPPLPAQPGYAPAPYPPAPQPPGYAPAPYPPAPQPPGYAPAPYPQAPQQPGYGAPQPGYNPRPPSNPNESTALEVGYLYVVASAYGAGLGVWFDAEAQISDPGLSIIAPALGGFGGAAGVYFLDQPPMPKGMPSAIATGMLLGAGEGLGIAGIQFTSATSTNEWSFRDLASAELIGSTLGGAGGYAFYTFLHPKPQTNIFLASSAFWGTVIGSEFGGGASSGPWGLANDGVATGGFAGYNLGLAAAAGLSFAWTPSWDQLGWMWGGLAVGTVASLPVYFFYVDGTHDARHGLIAQGVAGGLGLGAGALIGKPDRPGAVVQEEHYWQGNRVPLARVLGGGLTPMPGGVGAGVYGQLW